MALTSFEYALYRPVSGISELDSACVKKCVCVCVTDFASLNMCAFFKG